MQFSSGNDVTVQILFVYGLFVVIYLLLLRMLVYAFQHMWDTGGHQRSVIDRDIHQNMTSRIDTSMQSFDIHSLAVVIAKAVIAVLGMAAIFVILYIRFGLLVTLLIVGIALLLLWAFNYWSKNSRKSLFLRNELRKYVTNFGSVGMLISFSLGLALLLLVMIWIRP